MSEWLSRVITTLFIGFLGAFFIFSPSVVYASLPAQVGPVAADIVTYINTERARARLPELKSNSSLSKAAQDRSQILANSGRLVHVSAPKGQHWPELLAVGYKYIWSGENLALGYSTSLNTVEGWMASPGHRDNILSDKFKDVGVGVSYRREGQVLVPYIVAFFGQRKEAVATATASAGVTSSKLVSTTYSPPSARRSEEEERILRELITLLSSLLRTL